MLSASQGTYYLQKSSGRIGDNINYIYYFTYFHEYNIHPYWDEFEKEFNKDFEAMIKDKVEELEKSIAELESSYSTLSVSLKSLLNNIGNLIYYLVSFQRTLKDCIDSLETFIRNQIHTNKQLILNFITSIEYRIDKFNDKLKKYIDDEVKKIVSKLQPRKELEGKIKYTSKTISVYFGEINMVLRFIRKITLTFERSRRIILTAKNGVSNYGYGIAYKIINTFEKYEKYVISAKFDLQSQSVSSSIRELNVSFVKLLDHFKYENLDNKIKEVENYLKSLDECINQLKENKVKIEAEFEKLDSKLKNFKPTEHQKNLKLINYNYVVDITDILIKYQNYILEKRTRVVREIFGLQEQIENFKSHLKLIREKLQKLKDINDLNDKLNGYKLSKGQDDKSLIQKIREIVEKLKFNEKELKISINGKEFKYSEYCQNLGDIIETVKKLLEIEEVKEGKVEQDYNLLSAKCDLYQVKWRLENLQTYGNNLNYLIFITDSIQKLKSIRKDIDKIKPSKEKNNSANSDSTFGKLLKDDEKLNSISKTLGSIDNEIKGINNDKPNQSKLYDIKDSIDKLKLRSESINKYNEILKVINNLEISKTNGQSVVTGKLQEFSEKLRYFCVRLYAVSVYLYLYLKQNKNDGEIGLIKDSIQINIRDKIPDIQGNIKEIKSAATNINDKYTKYTQAFSAFSQKLLELERCLDYLVEIFLSCSLCTTTINYNSCPKLITD